MSVTSTQIFDKNNMKKDFASKEHFLINLPLEVEYRRRNNCQDNRDAAISFFNQRVIKNEHGRVSFQILYLAIYSNKSFKSLKCCQF